MLTRIFRKEINRQNSAPSKTMQLQNIKDKMITLQMAPDGCKEFYLQLGMLATAEIIALLYKSKIGLHNEAGLTPAKIDHKLSSIKLELEKKEKEQEKNKNWMNSEDFKVNRTMLNMLWHMYNIATESQESLE